MFFASDNAGPVLPEVMNALQEANQGYALGYGNDDLTQAVTAHIREIFEAPDACVYLVPTGTAANALALACIAQPYQTIFCAPMAHIHEDECAAPEFYSGAKLTPVGADDKITPADLKAEIERVFERGFQGVRPGAVSISQVTEFGQVYSLDEIKALSDVARAHDLPLHLDGARFANALSALGTTAAEMTWKAGVDAVSFGGTKNGCMGVEAVVLFDPSKADEFEARRKRGGHLFSKHRYLAAQMQRYLANDLWLGTAAKANGAAQRLIDGLRAIEGVVFDYTPQANVLFCALPLAVHARLQEAGAVYYALHASDTHQHVRLVCDWATSDAAVDQFLGLVKG